MKNKPILRWSLEQLLHLLLYIVGVVVCLFIFPFRDKIRKYNITPLWWFLNDTTKSSKSDIDYGDFGRFKTSYWGFLQQCAFRNSHWNLRLKLSVEQGTIVDIKEYYNEGKKSIFMFRNLTFLGRQKVFYTINGVRYFRMSKSVKGTSRLFNYQFGYSGYRAVFKIRYVKI